MTGDMKRLEDIRSRCARYNTGLATGRIDPADATIPDGETEWLCGKLEEAWVALVKGKANIKRAVVAERERCAKLICRRCSNKEGWWEKARFVEAWGGWRHAYKKGGDNLCLASAILCPSKKEIR